MKISYVKVIFLCESPISYVKYVLLTPLFYMWNFEASYFICELGTSQVKCSDFTYEMKISHVTVFQFHILFTCEMDRRLDNIDFFIR